MPSGFQSGDWNEIRLDIDPQARPDIIGTITQMTDVASESVDAIYSSHNIEHVYAHEVPLVLREFHRVLRTDGFVVITCPDLQSVAEHVAAGRLSEPLYQSPAGPIAPLDILYGHSASIARGQTYMAHRTGFTAESLKAHVVKGGFKSAVLRRRPSHFDLWLLATKQASEKAALTMLLERFALR
jgi:SAM-dependent methyltransferase